MQVSRFTRRYALAAIAATLTVSAASVTLLAQAQINGAGATFPNPIYSKWFSEYAKIKPGVNINYQSLGSGAGIRQLTNQTVFFGATDGPMTTDQLQAAPGKILHLPTVLGARRAGLPARRASSAELKFTGPLLADIFLGKVVKWNDPAIAKVNPGVKLPGHSTSPWCTARTGRAPATSGSTTSPRCRRSGRRTSASRRRSSGRSAWAARATKASPAWSSRRRARSATSSSSTRIQNKIAFGAVQNANGEFVKASIPAVTAAAAAAAKSMPADFRVSITNAPGAGVYPISSFTWLLLYENPKDKAQSKAMVEFMKWALTDGQKMATDLGYAPLPAEVVKLEQAALATIKVS